VKERGGRGRGEERGCEGKEEGREKQGNFEKNDCSRSKSE
jgi:hypothetical protein